jgi:formylglycine-generating enzyme required for sulfatase activity
VFSYHYGYRGLASFWFVGPLGPWDTRRILGTVPVEADGSAKFNIPANTPIALQPLDAEGKALQVMRSWFVGMPGEQVSCVGCHEQPNTVPPATMPAAFAKPARDLTPWRGPARAYGFHRELRPIIDRHCLGCHNGGDKAAVPDLRAAQVRVSTIKEIVQKKRPWEKCENRIHFDRGYLALLPYVLHPGAESDIRLPLPLEFHADTSPLVQMLQKGHHGVQLDAEAWDRLATWIDLNAPCYANWREVAEATPRRQVPEETFARRQELDRLYANLDVDREAPLPEPDPVEPILPDRLERPALRVACPDWPMSAEQARARQAEAGEIGKTITLVEPKHHRDPGVVIELALIPAGSFVMGSNTGYADEYPPARVLIDKPFYMATREVSNAAFRLFKADHDSRTFNDYNLHFYALPSLNEDAQPVLRVSWDEAMAFCRWLSERSGLTCSLPTEAQWEWACRAGTATPFFYGEDTVDHTPFANYAGVTGSMDRHCTEDGRVIYGYARDDRFDDGTLLTRVVHPYRGGHPTETANAWGLFDMHGNVAEWTTSAYRPYPYRADDGRGRSDRDGRRVVRGGSFTDYPKRCRSAMRVPYRPWQKVHNVGFRVVVRAEPEPVFTAVER